MDNVAPTRMNLLARRARIKLAADGVNLLKGKREALLKELIARARELRDLRAELHRRGRRSRAALAMARAVRGTPELRSMAVAGRRDVQVEVNVEKVWGLALARVRQAETVRPANGHGVGLFDSPSHLLEAAHAAEQLLEQVMKCGPLERNIQLIGEEIRATSRRINALDEHLLPRLREDVRSIARVLEEREREDVFRLKRIKSKRTNAGRTASGDVPDR